MKFGVQDVRSSETCGSDFRTSESIRLATDLSTRLREAKPCYSRVQDGTGLHPSAFESRKAGDRHTVQRHTLCRTRTINSGGSCRNCHRCHRKWRDRRSTDKVLLSYWFSFRDCALRASFDFRVSLFQGKSQMKRTGCSILPRRL